MKRFLATFRNDLQLQFRNGFYYASAFIALFWVILLRQVPAQEVRWLFPAFLLGNMLMNTFYFIAALVLLEKGEGTLTAQIVTPLRHGEYLASKVLSLGLLSLVESLIITLIGSGWRFNVLWFALGILVAGALYSLYGFIVVARYDSINEYLMPSMLYTAILSLPFLDYFGLVRSWLFYLHPVQAPLLLLKAAFQPVGIGQLLYALLYSALWVALLYWQSRQAFWRFVVVREGGR